MSSNNVTLKIALFFAVLLIFALAAVFGIFALAMLSQSIASMFQSGTIFLIQCSSSIVILALIVLVVYLFWRQQKLQTMLFSVLQNELSAQLPAQGRQAAALLPDAIVEFLPDQLPVELPLNSWQSRSPWEH